MRPGSTRGSQRSMQLCTALPAGRFFEQAGIYWALSSYAPQHSCCAGCCLTCATAFTADRFKPKGVLPVGQPVSHWLPAMSARVERCSGSCLHNSGTQHAQMPLGPANGLQKQKGTTWWARICKFEDGESGSSSSQTHHLRQPTGHSIGRRPSHCSSRWGRQVLHGVAPPPWDWGRSAGGFVSRVQAHSTGPRGCRSAAGNQHLQ